MKNNWGTDWNHELTIPYQWRHSPNVSVFRLARYCQSSPKIKFHAFYTSYTGEQLIAKMFFDFHTELTILKSQLQRGVSDDLGSGLQVLPPNHLAKLPRARLFGVPSTFLRNSILRIGLVKALASKLWGYKLNCSLSSTIWKMTSHEVEITS